MGAPSSYMGGYEINDLAKSVYTEREISWLKKEQSFLGYLHTLFKRFGIF